MTAVLALTLALGGVGAPDRGIATWYCCTRGYDGQAVVAMPGARYIPAGRPTQRVRVCVRQDDVKRCGVFPVVDFCGCPGERIVDLSTTAAHQLDLDLSRGIWPATVERVNVPRVPSTDTASQRRSPGMLAV